MSVRSRSALLFGLVPPAQASPQAERPRRSPAGALCPGARLQVTAGSGPLRLSRGEQLSVLDVAVERYQRRLEIGTSARLRVRVTTPWGQQRDLWASSPEAAARDEFRLSDHPTSPLAAVEVRRLP